MKIYLCATDSALFDEWRVQCGEFDFVEVVKSQSILTVDAEAIVSPANSFGVMSGGIDAVYKSHFGDVIELKVRQAIQDRYQGELPVGRAVSVPMMHINYTYTYLVCAPTMRVPENVSHTINSYLSTKGALIEADRVGIKSIVFPGMATGTGHMAPNDCARQMSAAIRDALVDKRQPPENIWEEQKHVRNNIAGSKWLDSQRY